MTGTAGIALVVTRDSASFDARLLDSKDEIKQLMAPARKTAVPQSPVSSEDVHYTVLIRLPFPRGDFIDPAPVSYIHRIYTMFR